jgi:L-alanine-DL-glutamate epimerase-like enolase superfamily enzyme
MAAEAVRINEAHGIDSFKIKVGVERDRDAETLRLTRSALPQATLYIDGNEAFDRQGGMAMLETCARYGIAWAEEPCHHDDRAARPLVGRGGAVPILGDESCRTPQEVAREIADGAIHMVSIKVARTGYARSRDILGLCRGHAVRPMVGSQGDSGLGVVAGGQFCAAFEETRALPAELSFHLNLADDLLAEAPRVVGGRLRLPDGPGLGVEIDRARLQHLAVN